MPCTWNAEIWHEYSSTQCWYLWWCSGAWCLQLEKSYFPSWRIQFHVFLFLSNSWSLPGIPFNAWSWGQKGPFQFLICLSPKSTSWALLWFCLFIEWILPKQRASILPTDKVLAWLVPWFSHKCPPSLRSSCLPTFDVLDTEICEQFKSFLQNIKSMATYLSQSHFCIYLQFMIYIWNCRKDGRWENINNVAIRIDEVHVSDDE